RKRIRPVHKGYLAGRAIFNTIAVLMFFKAVHATSSSEANILNMTYPLFIAIISWIFLKKERNLHSYLIVFLAFIGIFLIVNPFSIHASLQSLWGLGSGIVAAIAIIFLNLSRQYDDSDTILFFLFSSGTFFIFLLYFSVFHIPSGKELYYLGLCAINGILGQYLLTLGFRYITAIEGGIISSTRIILAAFLGPIIAQDPPSTIAGVIGAILIFLTNIYLITRKK
ncbi:MAG: DMT family transporter, partial [Leptospiraceae bacterium]|nr:DMT family transporter [Leptospiraceae bacterium]